jgi:hypothetical protein
VLWRCALSIPGQLPLRPVPGLGIDERGHTARNPFALGAPCAALAITELAIFEPPPPIWPPDIPGLRAIVVGFPFVERVAENLDDTALCPPAVLGLPGWYPLQRETPMNSRRCFRVVDLMLDGSPELIAVDE